MMAHQFASRSYCGSRQLNFVLPPPQKEGEQQLRPLLAQRGMRYTFTPKNSPYFNPCE